ncbi:MAG TPA: ATP-binding protein [Vicinamibacterales bacterium]|jgi:signal transduction histidine kinase/CheY-like chemotaxis protein|nr:ATP-binding protein [Vicinamibacterales bacterium]
MKSFRDQPLSRKALTLGVVPSVCAVLILAAASLTVTYLRARQSTRQDLAGQASILAQSLASALAFDDQGVANDTMHTLHVRDNVDAGCLFNLEGRLYSSFVRRDGLCKPTLDETRGGRRAVTAEQDVHFASKSFGTLVMFGNLSRFYGWMRAQSFAVLGALVGGVLIGFALTYRLQRAISVPVLDLARTADAVTATRNYSLRAVKTTDDEVGGLVQSFNAMLDELQRQNEALTLEIAERKRAEELKDAFLAAVSHELRTPLNAILGRVQILRHTKPTEDRLERSLESLERNAKSQARLVEDLLDVSRIVSGKFQLKTDVVDLRAVVNQAVEVASPQAAARSVSVDVRALSEPCLVSGDADRLQQAVLNLISNAIKFGNGTAVSVDLGAENADLASNRRPMYAVSVEDRGIGIAADFLPHVFDRFRQADSSMTRQQGGLGLGLAIVREVAELHQGSVTASSGGLGKGARFTIRLPQLIEADTPGVVARSVWAAGANAPLSGLRVLVVDDEPDGLDIAATTLTEAGASASRALSGGDAVSLWERGGFDALVCDLAMPGMDGFEVLARIRAYESKRGRRPAAVAVTAYASQDHRARSLAAGFDAHLAKPYDTDDLIAAIKTAIQSPAPTGMPQAT